jgi:ketosteroid isomerase-like protein
MMANLMSSPELPLRYRPSTLVGLALLLALPQSSRAQSAGDARHEVERTNQGFAAAVKSGNADAAGALTTEDVVLVEADGQRHDGRAAYTALVKQYVSLFSYPEFTISIEGFGTGGNVAWASGKESGTFVDKKSGKATSLTEQYLAIYERQPNGRYLMRYLLEVQTPTKPTK